MEMGCSSVTQIQGTLRAQNLPSTASWQANLPLNITSIFSMSFTTSSLQKSPNLGKGKDKAPNEYAEFMEGILR